MGEQEQNGVEGSAGCEDSGVPVVHVLDDWPKHEELKGTGHERVANAILDTVASEEGGKAIALEGPWGSGKSSVIEVLRDRCEHTDKSKPAEKLVYVFDAWKHEHDSLRLAFLSGLAKAMEKGQWLSKGQPDIHTQALDEMRGKVRTEKRGEQWYFRSRDLFLIGLLVLVPFIGGLGIALDFGSVQGLFRAMAADGRYVLAMLAIVPIAMVVLARAAAEFLDAIAQPGGIRRTAANWCGWVFALTLLVWAFLGASHIPTFAATLVLPPLAFSLALLFPFVGHRKVAVAQGEAKTWRGRAIDWLRGPSFVEAALRRQPLESTTTIRGQRPVTSEEFEERFLALLKDAFGDVHEGSTVHPGRRLVIVVDNLDRLEADHAKAMWTTLRTFIELPSPATGLQDDDTLRAKQVWFIVPYDPKTIPALWEHNTLENGQLAAGFLDKSFPVQYVVPPMISLHWRAVLRDKLKLALPDLKHLDDGPEGDSSFESIARLVSLYLSKGGVPPTPRAIVLFVNDLGALVRQHHVRLDGYVTVHHPDLIEFSIQTLAAYALLRPRPDMLNNPGQMASSAKPLDFGSLPIGWLTSTRKLQMACLHYNTHRVSDARELNLSHEILVALHDPSGRLLEDLPRNAMLEQCLDHSRMWIVEQFDDSNTTAIYQAIWLLHQLYMQCPRSSQEAIADLVDRLLRRSPLYVSHPLLPMICTGAVQMLPFPSTLYLLAGRLSSLGDRCTTEREAQLAAEAWIALIGSGRTALPSLFEHRFDSPPAFQIRVPGKKSVAVPFLQRFYADKTRAAWMWDLIELSGENGFLAMYHPDKETPDWPQAEAEALYVLRHVPSITDNWDDVSKRIASFIENKAHRATRDCDRALRALRSADGPVQGASHQSAAAFTASAAPMRSAYLDLVNSEKLIASYYSLFLANTWVAMPALMALFGEDRDLTDPPRTHSAWERAKALADRWFANVNTPPQLLEAIAASDTETQAAILAGRCRRDDAPGLLRTLLMHLTHEHIRRALPAELVVNHWIVLEKTSVGSHPILGRVVEALEQPSGESSHHLSRYVMEHTDHASAPTVARYLLHDPNHLPELLSAAHAAATEANHPLADVWASLVREIEGKASTPDEDGDPDVGSSAP